MVMVRDPEDLDVEAERLAQPMGDGDALAKWVTPSSSLVGGEFGEVATGKTLAEETHMKLMEILSGWRL